MQFLPIAILLKNKCHRKFIVGKYFHLLNTVYFRVHDVHLTEIGLASLLGLPWTLKVLWSPLVDRLLVPEESRFIRTQPRVDAVLLGGAETSRRDNTEEARDKVHKMAKYAHQEASG